MATRLRVIAGRGGRRSAAGRSFEQCYRDSYPMVYNYVLRRMASREATEDIVSEAFLHAARSFDRFDPERAKFSTWVISIARNCIVDYCRRERPTAALEDVPEGTYATEDEVADQSDDQELVINLLRCLDDGERELVFMKYYEGKRNVEIAEALGMNASTVSTKLARAMAKMRMTAN